MGIVKFIELGVWPIKLCLYCFNTSGSPHLNLPRVMSEMNSPTSSKIPSTNPWICTASRSFPVLSAGTTGMCRAEGMHRDVPLLRLELLVFSWRRSANFANPTRAETCPEIRSSCLPKPSRQSGHFGSICRLALIDGGGVLRAFSLGTGLLIASASARQQH